MNSQPHKSGSGIGGCLVLLLGAAGFFVFSPGLLLIAYWRYVAHAEWDVGQTWAFGISVSLLLWIMGIVVARGAMGGTRVYLAICFLSAWAAGFAYFGLKAEFVRKGVTVLFPPATTAAAASK